VCLIASLVLVAAASHLAADDNVPFTTAGCLSGAADEIQPGCGWTAGFHQEDLGTLWAFEVFDDGTGPALYVGGQFSRVAGMEANNIARWDGFSWSSLSVPGGNGVDDFVLAMEVFDDGSGPALYVGGGFATAGGEVVNGIARWDGSDWSALTGSSGTGVAGAESSVIALAVYDDGSGPDLYAGGSFTQAGGTSSFYIARWDGTDWSALIGPSGNGTTDTVFTLAVHDDGTGPSLFAGGTFTSAGGLQAIRTARWDGIRWWPLATALDTSVRAMAVFDDGGGARLYAGGYFSHAGTTPANYVAVWDGAEWAPLTDAGGTGVGPQYSRVESLSVYDDGSGPALYVGGSFQTAGGVDASNIARWNGSQWSSVTGPNGNGTDDQVLALTTFDDGSGTKLIAGGRFGRAGGVIAYHVARWDGIGWSALPGPPRNGMTAPVNALAVYEDATGRSLYAGGRFGYAGEVQTTRVARWDGERWWSVPGPSGFGPSSDVSDLLVASEGHQSFLWMGGNFSTVGSVSASFIARWNGADWAPVGDTNDQVFSLARAVENGEDVVYAGGLFTMAGGVTSPYVARYAGGVWSSLEGPAGNGTNGTVHAVGVFDGSGEQEVYAGGTFSAAGGIAADNIARWNGSRWSSLTGPSGQGVDDQVDVMKVFDDGSGTALFVGGEFTTAGGLVVNGIARWDGATWSSLTGASGTGVSGTVDSLAVWNDGTGPALIVGGIFDLAGGVPVNGIARWDGTEWSAYIGPAGTGLLALSIPSAPQARAITTYHDGQGSALYVGGRFDTAGGLGSAHIARWECVAPVFFDGFESGDLTAWGP
jgi:hypothetical protein